MFTWLYPSTVIPFQYIIYVNNNRFSIRHACIILIQFLKYPQGAISNV